MGGLTVDILENHFLRDHDDLDYLTLDLHSLISDFIKLFENQGWQIKLLENGDLRISRAGLKIQLGHVELSDKARWMHNGEEGSIWFAQEWLQRRPRNFYGPEVHVVEPEFQYVLLEHPQLLNPTWSCREKDDIAKSYLRDCIERKGTIPQSLLDKVSYREEHLLKTEQHVSS